MKFVVHLSDWDTSYNWCFEAADQAAADALVADYVAKCQSIADRAAEHRSGGGLDALREAHDKLTSLSKNLPFGFLMEEAEASELKPVPLDEWFAMNVRLAKTLHLTSEEIEKMDAGQP